jgi:hypothetical protein
MCYTFLPINGEGNVVTVKLSCKLDFLQELAREHAGQPHKAYLVGLLAEHAEDEECTAELLAWVRRWMEKG